MSKTPYEEGLAAGRHGIGLNKNPYRRGWERLGDNRLQCSLDWERGYVQAQLDEADFQEALRDKHKPEKLINPEEA